MKATRSGTLHGVCGCFITTLAGDVVISNVPGDSGTTNFAQAFFPVEDPVLLAAGDQISIQMDTHDGLATRWQVDVAREGQTVAQFDHSTFKSQALRPELLRKQADDYRPALTAKGAMERALLDAVRRDTPCCAARSLAQGAIRRCASISARGGGASQINDRALRIGFAQGQNSTTGELTCVSRGWPR